MDMLENKGVVTQKQLRIMKHMLGLDYKKKPYRNYYYVYAVEQELEELIKIGFAESRDASNNGAVIYHLTKKGVEFLIGKEISDRHYEEL